MIDAFPLYLIFNVILFILYNKKVHESVISFLNSVNSGYVNSGCTNSFNIVVFSKAERN